MARLLSGDFQDAQAAGSMAAGAVAAEAYYQLGLKYAAGAGVCQDYVAAHKWFNLAALQGNGRAKEERAAIAEEMSQQDVALAQRLAREWLATRH